MWSSLASYYASPSFRCRAPSHRVGGHFGNALRAAILQPQRIQIHEYRIQACGFWGRFGNKPSKNSSDGENTAWDHKQMPLATTLRHSGSYCMPSFISFWCIFQQLLPMVFLCAIFWSHWSLDWAQVFEESVLEPQENGTLRLVWGTHTWICVSDLSSNASSMGRRKVIYTLYTQQNWVNYFANFQKPKVQFNEHFCIRVALLYWLDHAESGWRMEENIFHGKRQQMCSLFLGKACIIWSFTCIYNMTSHIHMLQYTCMYICTYIYIYIHT